jgi:hypothetical protein
MSETMEHGFNARAGEVSAAAPIATAVTLRLRNFADSTTDLFDCLDQLIEAKGLV